MTTSFIQRFRTRVRDASLQPAYKLLLLTMSTYSNSDGENVYPSQETLANACGCSVRTVMRHLAHLQEAGWLTLTKAGNKDRRANVYRLLLGRDFAFAHGAVRLAPSEDDKPEAAPVERVEELPVRREVRPAVGPARLNSERPSNTSWSVEAAMRA